MNSLLAPDKVSKFLAGGITEVGMRKFYYKQDSTLQSFAVAGGLTVLSDMFLLPIIEGQVSAFTAGKDDAAVDET